MGYVWTASERSKVCSSYHHRPHCCKSIGAHAAVSGRGERTKVLAHGDRCDSAPRTFGRQVHLDRHKETHQESSRWPCPYCENSYTRRDAWNRHLARCTNAVDNARVPSGRINKACEACSARKIRCSHGQTCRRCAQSNTPCHYLVHGRTRQPRTPVSDTSSLQPAGIDSPDNRNDNRPLASTIPQMSTPIGADDTQYSLETGGTNPWLSWEWHEPPSSPCLLWLPKSAMA